MITQDNPLRIRSARLSRLSRIQTMALLGLLVGACGSLRPADGLATRPTLTAWITSTAWLTPTMTPTPAVAFASGTPLSTATVGATQELEPTPPPATYGVPLAHLRAGEAVTINEIHMINAFAGWAIGGRDNTRNHVLRTLDGGETWLDVTPPELPSAEAAEAGVDESVRGFFLDIAHAWVFYKAVFLTEVEPPTLWRTSDAGQSWTPTLAPSRDLGPNYFHNLFFVDERLGWLMADHDIAAGTAITDVFHSADGGGTWEALQAPDRAPGEGTRSSCNAPTYVAFADSQTGWMLNNCLDDVPSLWQTEDGGATWQYLEVPRPGDRLFCHANSLPVFFTPQFGAFALLCTDASGVWQAAYVYRTTDGGRTWEQRLLPKPPLPELTSTYFSSRFTEVEFVDSEVYWAIITDAGGEIQPEFSYVQSYLTYLYQSTDGGRSWINVKRVTWAGQFSFVDEITGWAVARAPLNEAGGERTVALVRTSDRGRTWQEIRPVIAP